MFDIPMNTSEPVSLSLNQQPQVQPVQPQMPQVQQTPTPPVQPQMQQTPVQTRPHRGGVYLKKGQKTTLTTPTGAALQRIKVGLYWECSGQVNDLDVECFMLGQDGRVIGDDWFVYYSQLTSPDGAVTHSGDCKDGSMPGDDEVITIDLTRLDPRVKRVIFVVTIDEALEHGYNFSMIKQAGVHVQDAMSGADLCQFQLQQFYDSVTSMMVGEIYNHNGQWKFNPIGDGVREDLYGLCMRYGVNVAD